jgi:membrane protease YdiL (CAAX protease family)
MPDLVTNAAIGTASIIVFGSVIGWGFVLVRSVRGEPACRYEPRRPVPWGLLDLGVIVFASFTVMIIAYALVSGLLGVRLGAPPADVPPRILASLMLCDSTASLVMIALACAYLYHRVRAGWHDFGMDSHRVSDDIRLGLAAFLMLVVPVYAIQMLLSWLFPDQAQHPLITMIESSADPQLVIAAVIVAVVVAPVVEEIFFRVLLQGWLENVAAARRSPQELILGAVPGQTTVPAVGPDMVRADESRPEWGGVEKTDAAVVSHAADMDGVSAPAAAREPANPYASPEADSSLPAAGSAPATTPVRPRRWPIFVSASIFAAMHLGHGYDFVPLFFLALGLGYLYQQTHRVLPCIVVHLLLNAGSLVMLWLTVTYGESP